MIYVLVNRFILCGRSGQKMKLLIALLVALIGFVGPDTSFAETAPTQNASIRGQNMGTFGRVVFDFRDLPQYEIKNSPGMIMMTFDQPLSMQVDNIGLELPTYISGARLDPDRKVLRFITLQKLTTNLTDVGEDLYLDLLPESWKGPPPGLPQEVIADLSRRARIAEAELRKTNAQTRVDIKVQVGSTPTLSRLSFDAGGVLPSRMTKEDSKIELVYDGLFRLDIGKLRSLLPRGFSRADVSMTDKSIMIKIEINEGLKVRTGTEDGDFLIDVQFKGVGELDAEPGTDGKFQFAAMTDRDRLPDPIETGVTLSDREQPGAAESSVGRSFGPPILDPALQIERLDDDSIENIVTRSLVQGADQGIVRFVYRPDNGGEIDIQMPEPAPVAAFVRGKTFWFVAESQAKFDMSALVASKAPFVTTIDTERKDFATFFRVTLPPTASPTVKSTPAGWKVSLFDPVAPLAKSIGIFSTRDDALRMQLGGNVPRAGRAVWVSDPKIGDQVLVVPSADESVGVSENQTFPEFMVLQSLQGLVLTPLVDDLEIKSSNDEIRISRAEGLNVSEEPFGGSARDSFSNLIVMEKSNWLIERVDDPWQRYRELFFDAAMASKDKRSSKRLSLARFLAANELYAEADGAFGAALLEDRALAESPFNRLEGAIYKALSGNYEEAEKSLAAPELTGSLEALLWRAFVAAKRQNWPDSVQFYQNSGKIIDTYPDNFANLMRLAIGEAAIEQGEMALATEIVGGLPIDGDETLKDRSRYLRALLKVAYGDPGSALTDFDRLAEVGDRPTQMKARLARTLTKIEKGQISAEEAVVELQTLALTWRGNFVEAKALIPLIRMLLDQGDWREALVAARRVNIHYADQKGARSILNEVSARLANLLEGGNTPTLTDVSALSIFMDFKEFLPVGRRGDELIRTFADKLVDAELLPQAAELLKYQIDNRYEGIARASIATRLAYIYLMDKRPLSALEVLSSTRLSNMPEDIRRSRLLLEARARAEVGNPQLALELLESESGADLDMLRADIYWYAKNNARAGELYEKSLDRAWAELTPLSPEQSRVVLKAAIAYALANDNFSMDRLKSRYAVKMARTPDAAPFRLLTLRTESPAALARELAGTVTSGKYLDGFMAYYRDRYIGNQS